MRKKQIFSKWNKNPNDKLKSILAFSYCKKNIIGWLINALQFIYLNHYMQVLHRQHSFLFIHLSPQQNIQWLMSNYFLPPLFSREIKYIKPEPTSITNEISVLRKFFINNFSVHFLSRSLKKFSSVNSSSIFCSEVYFLLYIFFWKGKLQFFEFLWNCKSS